LKNFYKNKKVLITGHTGFKGSWLSCILNSFESKVYGISDGKINSLLYKKKIANYKKEYFLDLKEEKKLKKIITKIQPDIIFHLAAQSLVFKSYINPSKTWQSNLFASLNILEASRSLNKNIILIMITSDKCYKNKEIDRGYTEIDELGGDDPYSASKAATEIMIKSYFHSFLKQNKKIKIATARAGNVIGGGDWSDHRLVPDLIKSWNKNKKVKISNPKSTRPWQHVLEPLNGYLKLAEMLNKKKKLNGHSFNFGPNKKNNYTVLDLTKKIAIFFKKENFWTITSNKNFHEAKLLKLNSKKSEKLLKWKPKLNFKKTAEYTASWYLNYYNNKTNLKKFTFHQISKYFNN
jgi:CDP-glucose 4,6-dehydratase